MVVGDFATIVRDTVACPYAPLPIKPRRIFSAAQSPLPVSAHGSGLVRSTVILRCDVMLSFRADKLCKEKHVVEQLTLP